MSVKNFLLLAGLALIAASIVTPSGAGWAQRGGGGGGGPHAGGGPPGGFGASGGFGSSLPSQAMDRMNQGRPDWAGRPDEVGRPDGIGRPDDPGVQGRERAAEAQAQHELQTQKLPAQEQDKARDLAARFPANYELDRNGALAVRGQVLATNLPDAALAKAQNAGFTVLRRTNVEGLGLSVVVLTHADWPVAKMVDRLRRLAPDAAIEPDHIFFASGTAKAKPKPITRTPRPAPAAPSGPGWRLGIIDTGAAPPSDPHVQIVRRGFAPGGFVPDDHGSAVAAIATHPPGRSGVGGGQGLLYLADIFGGGPRGGSAEQMVRAMGWLAQQQVPVTNVSMVGPYNAVVATAVGMLVRRGFVIVAPVGNDGAAARPLYPASLDGVVAVSAVDQRGMPLPEASRVRKVDFAAPGIAQVRDAAGRAAQVRGTSYASPVVARALADRVTAPDPDRASAAITALAAAAWRPAGAPRGTSVGRGIVGLAPPATR
jgi:hypothetical protein